MVCWCLELARGFYLHLPLCHPWTGAVRVGQKCMQTGAAKVRGAPGHCVTDPPGEGGGGGIWGPGYCPAAPPTHIRNPFHGKKEIEVIY